MANVLLGVTGSVAAVRTPDLFAAFRALGHDVRVVATDAATYFFDPVALDPGRSIRNPAVVSLDEDEWPGERYARGDDVLHIELRRWADIFVVAPLDANTLGKFASGLCDNCLTCVWRAWDPARPVVVAPAMNTFMWQHPMTLRHLRAIAADSGASHVPGRMDDEATIAVINERAGTLRVVGPVSKRLACGDVGAGAMAGVDEVAATAQGLLMSLVRPDGRP